MRCWWPVWQAFDFAADPAGRQFTSTPVWGTAGVPETVTDIGKVGEYKIDLTRWAPPTWDQRCWVTLYMQKTGRRVGHVMIARNTELPALQVTRFHTIRDNQPSVAVEVVEGGNASGMGGTQIGRCVIDHLPPKLPKGTPVDVAFRYDLNGLIHIEAILPSTGQRTEMTIDRAAGLSGDDRDKMQEVFDALGLNE